MSNADETDIIMMLLLLLVFGGILLLSSIFGACSRVLERFVEGALIARELLILIGLLMVIGGYIARQQSGRYTQKYRRTGTGSLMGTRFIILGMIFAFGAFITIPAIEAILDLSVVKPDCAVLLTDRLPF